MILMDLLCGGIYFVLLAGVLLCNQPYGYGTVALVIAYLATGIWAFAIPAMPQHILSGLPGSVDLARSIAWYGFLLVLFRRSVADRGQLGHAFATMGAVMLLAVGAATLVDAWGRHNPISTWAVSVRIGLAICNLLLVENLIRNVPSDTRWQIKPYCIAIGALSVFDVILFSGIVLLHGTAPLLVHARVAAALVVAPLLALAGLRDQRWRKIQFSPDAALHSATLVLTGLYLLAVVAADAIAHAFDASWGMLPEIGAIFAALVLLLVLVTSVSARSYLRNALVRHFRSPRYDYRKEWTRCIDALSAPSGYTPLHVRVVRVVADTVDSPAGALYLRDEHGQSFRWAASWNWPGSSPIFAPGSSLLASFQQGKHVVEIDGSMEDCGGAWLAVPLTHLGDQIGFVLVAGPRAPFELDNEVFDLLRIIGHETAAIIAEQRAIARASQAQELHAYGTRFAFVAHDIKNIAGQLTLLVANAERHIHVPEFQRDMIATLRSSTTKIGLTLGRLRDAERVGFPSGGSRMADADTPGSSPPVTDIISCVQRATARRQDRTPPLHVELSEGAGRIGEVKVDRDVLETVITHLLDNAVEASEPNRPIVIRGATEGTNYVLDVVDHGCGMTAEFVRDELFRPFASSKPGGSGIGAFQARELLQEVGGDLLVFSKPGEGTTMRLVVPILRGASSLETSFVAVEGRA